MQVDYLTNIDILELTQLPEHLMIMELYWLGIWSNV
jgi:hypothetical protein